MAIRPETVLANLRGYGSEHPKSVQNTAAVRDLEFLEFLDQLTMTINKADSVIGTNSASSSRVVMRSTPDNEPYTAPALNEPQLFANRVASPRQPLPERRKGVSSNISATITALALVAGIGWLLYANPLQMEDKTQMARPQSTSATQR
jgi:hypothetical protein